MKKKKTERRQERREGKREEEKTHERMRRDSKNKKKTHTPEPQTLLNKKTEIKVKYGSKNFGMSNKLLLL